MTDNKTIEQQTAEAFKKLHPSKNPLGTEWIYFGEGYITAMKELAGRTASSNEWVSVEEKLPKEGQWVWGSNGDGIFLTAYQYRNGFIPYAGYPEKDERITHWQLIPDSIQHHNIDRITQNFIKVSYDEGYADCEKEKSSQIAELQQVVKGLEKELRSQVLFQFKKNGESESDAIGYLADITQDIMCESRTVEEGKNMCRVECRLKGFEPPFPAPQPAASSTPPEGTQKEIANTGGKQCKCGHPRNSHAFLDGVSHEACYEDNCDCEMFQELPSQLTGGEVSEGQGEEIKEGQQYILDKGYNSENVVTVVKVYGKHYCSVTDGSSDQWDTMCYRLSPMESQLSEGTAKGEELKDIIARIIEQNNNPTATAKIIALVEEHYSSQEAKAIAEK